MKRFYKLVSGLALSGLLSLSFIPNAVAQRGLHGGGFRGGLHIGGGFGYRGGFYPGWSFGFGYGYPHFGFRLNVLPYGYYPFYYGPDLYYYYGGTFYRPYDGGGYQVVVPPVGATVPQLPTRAQLITINNQQYYEFNGVYYKETVNDKGEKIYVVAGKNGVLNTDEPNINNEPSVPSPQVDDIVTRLPDGCRKVKLNGKKYFVSPDDIYYEEFIDANNDTSYRVVSTPTDQQ